MENLCIATSAHTTNHIYFGGSTTKWRTQEYRTCKPWFYVFSLSFLSSYGKNLNVVI